MPRLRLFSFGWLSLWLIPAVARAAQPNTITVPGLKISLSQLMRNLVYFLAFSSIGICTALFLIGAFYMVVFAHDENRLKMGKDLMIGSLIGLAVILGAYAILRTTLLLIYPTLEIFGP